MAEKVISFKIDIQGTDQQIAKIAGLGKEIDLLTKNIKNMSSGRDVVTGKFVAVDREAIAQAQEKLKELKSELRSTSTEVQKINQIYKSETGSIIELSNVIDLNKRQYRALSAEKRNDIAIGGKLIQTIAEQEAELQKLEAEMGNYQRNVGNYKSGNESLRSELRSLTQQLAQMEMQGQGNTAAFQAMAMKAGEMQDALSDTRNIIKALGSDTKYITGLVKSVQGAAGAFSVLQGIMALSGNEDKELQKSMQKLMASMTVMQGLQEVANVIQKDSEVMQAIKLVQMKASVYWTGIQAAATGEATIAQKALNIMMALNPAGIMIAAMTALVAVIGYFILSNKDAEIAQKRLNAEIEASNKAIEILKNSTEDYIEILKARGEGENEIYKIQIENLASLIEEDGRVRDQLIDNYMSLTDAQKEELTKRTENIKKNNREIEKLQLAQDVLFEKQQREATKIHISNMKDGLKKEKFEIEADYQEKVKLAGNNLNLIAELTTERDNKLKESQKKYNLEYLKQEYETNNLLEKSKIALILNIQEREKKALIQENIEAIQGLELKLKTETNLTKIQRQRIKDVIINIKEKEKTDLLDIDKKYIKESQDLLIKGMQDNLLIVQNLINEKEDAEKEYEKFISSLKLESEQERYSEKLKLIKQEEDKRLKILDDSLESELQYFSGTDEEKNTLINKAESERLLITKHFGKLRAEAEAETERTIKDILISGIAEKLKIKNEDATQIYETALNLIKKISDGIFSAEQENIQKRLAAQIKFYEDQNKAELEELELKNKQGLLSEEAYKGEQERINKKFADKKNAEDKKAFENMKAQKQAELWINFAAATIQLYAENHWVLATVLAGLLAIETGIQSSKIASENWSPKYEKGGLIYGNSHNQGGVNVNAEGGEAVINRKSIASKDILSLTGTPGQIASQLNSYKGYGIPFMEMGGIVPVAPNSISQMSNIDLMFLGKYIVEGINNKQVILSEKELRTVQNRVQVIENDSKW